tara:strand:- start:6423 stop:6953 length:531 start_codon:yes stop_codon:yes gene_type:complete
MKQKKIVLIRSLWRKRVFEKELDKRLSSKRLDTSFKIKKVAIIVDPNNHIESKFFLDFANDFNILEVKISILKLSNFPKSDNQFDQIFNLNDLNYWSNFKGDLLNFCETDYDLLINYYNINDTLYSLISTRTKQKLSVGFSGADPRINDLIFDFDPKDRLIFKSELIKYLTILNKI